MSIGVVIVSFNCGEDVVKCVSSLLASEGADLKIVIVDNASTDDTLDTILSSELTDKIETVQTGRDAPSDWPVVLIKNMVNSGFAGGVNTGLMYLEAQADVEAFWILNPDATVPPTTAARLLSCIQNNEDVGIVGSRICYASTPEIIQNDGGSVSLWTGICHTKNMLSDARTTPMPDASTLDFISGANMMVSREFLKVAGYMPEGYFLYFEETDWCLRRKHLKIYVVNDAPVYHKGGASIGSATVDNSASPLSTYFMARSRRKFISHYRPYALPIMMGYTALKALRMIVRGQKEAGIASLRGLLGLPLPQQIRVKLGSATF